MLIDLETTSLARASPPRLRRARCLHTCPLCHERVRGFCLFWGFFDSLARRFQPHCARRLQYSYEARFTLSAYLCMQCAQSLTLEHYFAGSLFERYINRNATKALFRRFTGKINYFWTFLWRTSNLILRPIKPSSLKLKKADDFHAGVSR